MLDNLTAAREQMAISLSFHIIFAVLGVGMPWLMLYAEARGIRTGDPIWTALARRWAKASAIIFAIGAVSGTVLSFEFGLLWPNFMATYSGAFGVSFSLEAFAFFAEAIFLGLYFYGWDRLTPRAHWWTGVPVAIGGLASAGFVTTANAWMNAPVGIVMQGGKIVAAEPFAPFASPTSGPQVTHMLLAALLCTGFAVAAVYAVGMLRGRRDAYHRRGLASGLVMGLVAAPLQVIVGDWAVRVVAETQPVKMAAMEGLGHTMAGAPLSVGGIYDAASGQLKGALEIPKGLSLLLSYDPNAVVTGLDSVPAADRPSVAIVHLCFDLMVGIGTALVALGVWTLWYWWRHRKTTMEQIGERKWYLRAVVIAGPAAMVALIAGWIVTEVGRQPWIVFHLMRTTEAVSDQPGLYVYFYAAAAIYTLLAVTLVILLRRIATGAPKPEEVAA
jgi:cytochrome d ubiquinol oxidase subunit I